MTTNIDANDWLMSSGVRPAKFTHIGKMIEGHIMRDPDVTQQRDLNTGELKFWSSGDPMMQMRVILMTEEVDPEDPEDSGERALYIRGAMQKAVAAAVRQAGARGLAIGGKLRVKYIADGKASKAGLNPPKVYEAKYRAPALEPVPVPEPPATATITEVDPDSIPF